MSSTYFFNNLAENLFCFPLAHVISCDHSCCFICSRNYGKEMKNVTPHHTSEFIKLKYWCFTNTFSKNSDQSPHESVFKHSTSELFGFCHSITIRERIHKVVKWVLFLELIALKTRKSRIKSDIFFHINPLRRRKSSPKFN